MTPEKLRKHQNTLVVIGAGVIAFGLWSVIRSILTITLQRERFWQAAGGDDLNGTALLLGYVFVGLLLALDLGLRLYVGLRARAEGFGKRRGTLYLVLAGLMFLTNALIFVAELGTLKSGLTVAFDEFLVGLVVELTSAITLLELVIAGIQVKRLKKALGPSAGED